MNDTREQPIVLTPEQHEALEAVKRNPNRTVEDYAAEFGNTQEIYEIYTFLIFKAQYLTINLVNGAVKTKSI